jgi:hypothetical protein
VSAVERGRSLTINADNKKIYNKKKKGDGLGDEIRHAELVREKRAGAIDEFEKGRYTNVGDLALKAAEQAVEACASRENLHFHTRSKTAHAERARWLRSNFPELAKAYGALWGIYADLGYDGLDGERAEKAIEVMEEILDVLERKTGIRFK